MLAESEVRLPVNTPVPVPEETEESASVGYALVDHTNPLSVTAEYPAATTVPFPVALELVMSVAAWVVTFGGN